MSVTLRALSLLRPAGLGPAGPVLTLICEEAPWDTEAVWGAAVGGQHVAARTALPEQALEDAPCQGAGWGVALKSTKCGSQEKGGRDEAAPCQLFLSVWLPSLPGSS